MSKIYKIASNPDSTRFYINHCFLYPFGNTPASDLTRGCQTNSDINFLLLGCGDIRNILFTIKTLVEEKSKCKNLYFHVNDREDVILARNLVLFNILDNIDPEKDEDIEFLWSVWYDMAIPKGYYKRLLYIIQDLLQNPNLGVEYGTKETGEEIKRVLKYWLKVNMTIETAKINRSEALKPRLESAKLFQMNSIPHEMYGNVQVIEWVQEIHNFIEGGSTYKGTLHGPFNLCTNPTLFCPHLNGWRVHPDGTPFHSYNLYGLTEGLSLFHNCLSQLKTMVCAWRQFTSREDTKIKVFLWLGHCLTLCNHTLPADLKFDFIDTSNVADHLGVLNLLVSCSELLKPSGILITETMRGGAIFKSMEHYLNFSIGVPSTFFPVIFNMHLAEDSEIGTSEPRSFGFHLGANRIIIRWLKDGKDAEPIDINGSPDVLKIFKVLIQTCMPLELQDIEACGSIKTPSLLIHIVRNMKDNVVGGAKILLEIILESQPSLKTKSGHVFYPYENSLRTTWLAYIDQLGCVWPRGNEEQKIVLLDFETRPISSVTFSDEILQRGTVFMNFGDYFTMAQHVPPNEPWFFVTTIAYEMVGKIKLLLPTDVWETLRTSACLTIGSFSNLANPAFGLKFIKEDPKVKIADSLQMIYRPMTQEEKPRHLRVTEYADRYEIHFELHDRHGEKSNLKVARGSEPTELLVTSSSASSRCRVRCPILEVQTMGSMWQDSWTITATKDLKALNGPIILKYRRLDIGACPTVTMTPEQFQKIVSTNFTHEAMKRIGIEMNDPHFNIVRLVIPILELAMFQDPSKPLVKAYFIPVCAEERHYGQIFGTVSYDIFIHFRKCHMLHGILCLDIDWVDFEKANQYINEGKITRREVDLYCDTHGGQSGATHHLFEVTTKEAILLRKLLILNTMKSKQRQKGQRCQWVFNSFLQPVFSIDNNFADETVLSDMKEAFANCFFNGIGRKARNKNSNINEKLENSGKVCRKCLRPSPSLRACRRCRSAFYCGKECQTRDWPNHKQSCNIEKRPELTITKSSPTLVCSSCSIHAQHLRACSKCHSTFYCGKECQRKHWPSHKKSCKTNTQSDLIAKEEVQTKTEKVCSCCACQTPHLKSCTRCHTAFYCGKECQARDWPNHKQSCKSNTRPNLITKEQVQTKTEKVCSRCECQTPDLKSCTRCHTAFYCGRECQKRDWPNHKQSCKSNTRSNLIAKEQVQTKTEKVCSSCACQTPDLKSCTRCHTAFYCGRECQKRDWPNHKQSCKSITWLNLIAKEQVQTKTNKVCSNCACQTPDLKSCTRCHTAFYCGRECQKRDWPNHKQSCISKNE